MSLEEALNLACVFSHYLNLMGIAEVHHRVHRQKNVASLSKSCDDIFNQLLQRGVSLDQLYDTVCKQVGSFPSLHQFFNQTTVFHCLMSIESAVVYLNAV